MARPAAVMLVLPCVVFESTMVEGGIYLARCRRYIMW